jgi:rhodanese-related sulfurtransferase
MKSFPLSTLSHPSPESQNQHSFNANARDPMKSIVTQIESAPPAEAAQHFSNKLRYETDCADVYGAIKNNVQDFILFDVRTPTLFARSHIPGASNVPHGRINAEFMASRSRDELYVVYCAGPHCNGADKAALKLARLGFRAKVMPGGVTGWIDEGYSLDTDLTED